MNATKPETQSPGSLHPDCSAIVWLADRYEALDAEIYPNPLGDGWCCSLAIMSAGIKREAAASNKAEAAHTAAEIVARELGWQNNSTGGK